MESISTTATATATATVRTKAAAAPPTTTTTMGAPSQDLSLLRTFRRIGPSNFTLALLLGCFLLTFAYFSMPKFDSFHLLPLPVNSPTPNAGGGGGSATSPSMLNQPEPAAAASHNETTFSNANAASQIDEVKDPQNAPKQGVSANITSITSNNASASNFSLSTQHSSQTSLQQLDGIVIDGTKDVENIADRCKNGIEFCEAGADSASNKSSINVFGSTEMPPSVDIKQQNWTTEKEPKKENKRQVPLCDLSQKRIDKCEIEGDVRIMGKNATVMWVPSPEFDDGPDYERKVWQIKPYPRKENPAAMAHVSVVTVKPMDQPNDAPACTVHRDVPAIVFSDRGYTGNYFHDFTDVLVPIFTTARKFQGEIDFLVADIKVYLISKYLPIFKNLTKYDIVDFDSDDQVRCYPKAYVGLTSHDDFGINPDRIPERYTLVDFTKFMRTTYELKRDVVEIPIQKTLGRKPRLMIIARARTRRFMNLDQIVSAAEKLGFEVVATETTNDLPQISVVVNSCDAIMGVHGAGLTNMVFLPINAVFIQILPWGGLEWVAGNYFKRPVVNMKLKYLQYDIAPEESTLIEEYPRNHTVFTNPESIRRQGWDALKEVFLDKQNVRLNMKRFRPTLKKALKYLNSVDS